MAYDTVWKQISYEAKTSYLENIKSKVSITKPVPYWNVEKGHTMLESYLNYIGMLLNKIADELKEKVSKEKSVLVIPAEFVPVLYFGPFDRAADTDFVGPYFIGTVSESVSVIVDPACQDEFYAFNIDNYEKVLKLEIQK